MQTLPQCGGAKVDEQTDGSVRQLEISQKLLAVDSRQSLHRFEFHDDAIINQEVNAQSFLEHHPVVFETDGLLSLDLKSPLVERPRQHSLVHGFQQPRAQVTMDAERGVHDSTCKIGRASCRERVWMS